MPRMQISIKVQPPCIALYLDEGNENKTIILNAMKEKYQNNNIPCKRSSFSLQRNGLGWSDNTIYFRYNPNDNLENIFMEIVTKVMTALNMHEEPDLNVQTLSLAEITKNQIVDIFPTTEVDENEAISAINIFMAGVLKTIPQGQAPGNPRLSDGKVAKAKRLYRGVAALSAGTPSSTMSSESFDGYRAQPYTLAADGRTQSAAQSLSVDATASAQPALGLSSAGPSTLGFAPHLTRSNYTAGNLPLKSILKKQQPQRGAAVARKETPKDFKTLLLDYLNVLKTYFEAQMTTKQDDINKLTEIHDAIKQMSDDVKNTNQLYLAKLIINKHRSFSSLLFGCMPSSGLQADLKALVKVLENSTDLNSFELSLKELEANKISNNNDASETKPLLS